MVEGRKEEEKIMVEGEKRRGEKEKRIVEG